LAVVGIIGYYSGTKYSVWHIVIGILGLALGYTQIKDVQEQRKNLLIGCFIFRTMVCVGILFGCLVRMFYVKNMDAIYPLILGVTWLPTFEIVKYFQDKTIHLFIARMAITILVIMLWFDIY
ncbi:MAG: hypothetical protein K8I00_11055, partial [Candidatus Omnitrophica bacterium]|nr:hypothetical protein [Candidatus Omnitrophota bacterium]